MHITAIGTYKTPNRTPIEKIEHLNNVYLRSPEPRKLCGVRVAIKYNIHHLVCHTMLMRHTANLGSKKDR